MIMISFCKVFHLLSLVSLSVQQNEKYHEELVIKPLPNGYVNTYFQFTTRWNLVLGEDLFNTNLTPRSVSEILQQLDVEEFHVSLTQGLWRHKSWGYPVLDASPGAEIWAWFSNMKLTENDIDEQWKTFCNTLSGILCASLNFVDSTNSVQPKFSFRPKFGTSLKTLLNQTHIRYSTLPREMVCTENLTPWKKLLPCSTKTGFTSLLNSGYIHNTNYHSLRISVRKFCETKADANCLIEITQSANLVYDSQLLGISNQDFSIRRIFGQGLMGSCSLAETSRIYVDITDNHYYINPQPINTITSKRGGITTIYGLYDMKNDIKDNLFNIVWENKNKKLQISPLPPLYAHRYILGQGHENGKIITEITNTYWTPLNIIIQENIPWFVPCYLHTLTVKIVNIDMNDGSKEKFIKPKFIYFVPGKQRERPYHLEIGVIVPASTTLQMSVKFDYTFLKWLEYPPDASHGHYLGSATISTMLPTGRNYTSIPLEGYLFAHSFNGTRSSYFLQIRTESLILSFPTPDFSMPYNVICLACTVVALAFGPIHSVATKKILIEKKTESQALLVKLKEKYFNRKQTNKNKECEDNIEVTEKSKAI